MGAELQEPQQAVAQLRQQLRDTQTSLLHHQAKLVRINEKHRKLMADLQTEFQAERTLRSAMEARLAALQGDLSDNREAGTAAAGTYNGFGRQCCNASRNCSGLPFSHDKRLWSRQSDNICPLDIAALREVNCPCCRNSRNAPMV